MAREVAAPQPWTLAQILKELRIPQADLAVLSACESGVVDTNRLPDEFLGLPAGFLEDAKAVRLLTSRGEVRRRAGRSW